MTALSTTDDPLPTTPGVAQFFVQPQQLVKIEPGQAKFVFLICDYFDENWNRLKSRTMESQKFFFRVTQDPAKPLAGLPPDADEELQNLRLAYAVAKTLDSTCNLNNTFVATEDAATGLISVVMPVLPGTTRGVILVFRSPGTTTRPEYLVATSDPEIKNGSNNGDD